MNLYELLENCYLDHDVLKLDIDKICQIIRENYTDKQLRDLIHTFLRGIGSKHQVPGNLVYKLNDLINWYTDYESYTFLQQALIIKIILCYWDQLSIETKADLYL